MDITYTARALASCTTSTDSTRLDDVGTIVLSTQSVAYDYHINPIHSWTDTTICKENDLVSLV